MGEPTDVAAAAKRRLAELKAETEKLEGFLATYAELSGQQAPSDQPVEAASVVTDAPKPKPSASSRIIGAARQAMIDAGRPLGRSELVEAIESKGLVVGGTNKGNNLGSMLWRTKGFETDRDGYWPKGEPRPGSSDDLDL